MEKIPSKSPRLGSAKKKILLLIYASVALSVSKTTGKQWKILGELSKEWKKINRISLNRGLDSLYNAKLINLKPKGNEYEIILTSEGKRIAARFDLDNLKIHKQKDWDGKWRIVMFDVPERIKKVRDAIRFHFKEIGLVEYQKSVFISPYPCEKEIKFIAEFYRAFSSIRFIVANAISDEDKYIKEFDID